MPTSCWRLFNRLGIRLEHLTPMTFHLIDFLCLWLGFLLFFVSVVVNFNWRNWYDRIRLKALESAGPHLRNFNDALIASFKTRLGKLAQTLGAVGLTVEMFAGGYWLVMKIAARQATG